MTRAKTRAARRAISAARPPEPKALESTLLSAIDFADLTWLLREDYRGDVGVRSRQGDLEDLLNRMCPSSGPEAPKRDRWDVMHVHETLTRKPVALDEAALRAAGRLRRVLHRWRDLDADTQELLAYAYRRTREAIPGWGELGAVAMTVGLAHVEHRRSKTTAQLDHWLAGLRGRGGEANEVFFAIQRVATARLRRVCDAWAATYRTRTL